MHTHRLDVYTNNHIYIYTYTADTSRQGKGIVAAHTCIHTHLTYIQTNIHTYIHIKQIPEGQGIVAAPAPSLGGAFGMLDMLQEDAGGGGGGGGRSKLAEEERRGKGEGGRQGERRA